MARPGRLGIGGWPASASPRSYVAFANPSECWVVERDALDIPYVVRYEIVR
ncbi:hypothetical protein [Candidatus Palauibacter sp.]|uniref:hypothetical protein n=1 Tax=Candidatus Palauibacter sp. TaxID=3101350 RepID=UPI003B5BD7AD